MTRTRSILSLGLVSIVALLTAAPATAATPGDAYRSADSIVAAAAAQRSDTEPSAAANSEGYRSVDAILADQGAARGAAQPSVAQVAMPAGDEGLTWADARAALVASAVLLVMLAAARSVTRHRRATAGSRA